ncbi:MAG TPA: AraC family transcriptional regulator [Rhizobiaceae bacterium]
MAIAATGASPDVSESTFRIDLPHMDVVLSISAQPTGRAGNGSAGLPIDPMMEGLLSQLRQADKGDGDDGVQGEDILLAVVARWLWLRSVSEAQQDAGSGALQKWRLKRVMTYIDEHIGESVSLADLAGAAGLSRMYFAARFRAATGLRPREYILRRRVERAKEMLAQSDDSLVDIAFNVGFQTQAHFTTVFKRFAGITPGRWRVAAAIAPESARLPAALKDLAHATPAAELPACESLSCPGRSHATMQCVGLEAVPVAARAA